MVSLGFERKDITSDIKETPYIVLKMLLLHSRGQLMALGDRFPSAVTPVWSVMVGNIIIMTL